jgi:hypothetical protein
MKGFLNKVQTKVGGGKTGEGKGNGVESVAGAAAVARAEVTPRADISLPKRHDRRRSSLSRHARTQNIKELPLLSETPMLKREVNFVSVFFS